MRDFLDQTGLVRDRFREQVHGVSVRALNPKTIMPMGKQVNVLPSGFNRIRGEHTYLDDLAVTNPNFATGKSEWTCNCQRCVTAYEGRRRGLDVEAMPMKIVNGEPDKTDKFLRTS